MTGKIRSLSCNCGKVRFETVGAPILTAVCYCDDCQEGAKLLQDLPNAKTIMDEDGGCSYLTYRDDRFRCVAGGELLKGYKLKEKAPTQRFAASCCNTGIYLKYAPGHWVSIYRSNFTPTDLPSNEMRTQTRFRQSDSPLPDDAPCYKRFPLKLFIKLIAARMAMLFGR